MKREERKDQKEAAIHCRELPFLFGAGSRGRTDTVSLPPDFESGTSANSIIPAYDLYSIARRHKKSKFFVLIGAKKV